MSAKILKALSEDPQLEKEIGCMTGILQMFDRHQAITGRRYGHRRLQSGDGARSSPSSGSGSPRLDASSQAVAAGPPEAGKTSSTGRAAPRLSFYLKEGSPPSRNSPSQGRPSSDIREVVRASFSRDGRSRDAPRASLDLKEPPRFSVARDGPRLSLDSKVSSLARQPKQARDAARHSADGRNRDFLLGSLELRETASGFLQSRDFLTSDDGAKKEVKRRVPNVVARLMGLEELPPDVSAPTPAPVKKPSSEAKVLQQLLQQKPKEVRKAGGDERRQDLQKQVPEAILTVLKHSEEVRRQQESSESLLGELEQRLQQLRVKNSVQERKTLRQILEAMQLKGLLYPPRVRSEAHLGQLDNMIDLSLDSGKAVSNAAFVPASIVLMRPVSRPGGDNSRMHKGAPSLPKKAMRAGKGTKSGPREPMSRFISEETVSYNRKKKEAAVGTGSKQAGRNVKAAAATPKRPSSSPKDVPVTTRQQAKAGVSGSRDNRRQSRSSISSGQQPARPMNVKEADAPGKRNGDAEAKKVLRRCSSDVGQQQQHATGESVANRNSPDSPRLSRLTAVATARSSSRMGCSLSDSEAAPGRRASRGVLASRAAVPPNRQPIVREAAASPAAASGTSVQGVGKAAAKGTSEIRSNSEEARDHSCDVMSSEEHLASRLPYPEVSVDKFEQESSPPTRRSFSGIESVLLHQEEVKKYLGEEAIAEGAEQPSPVSVLDTPFHDEEHSPRAVNKNAVCLKDGQFTQRLEALANQMSWADDQKNELPEERVVTALPDPPTHAHAAAAAVDGSKMAYVRDILMASGFVAEGKQAVVGWHSAAFPMDPELFDRSEEKRWGLMGSKRQQQECPVDEMSRIERLRRSEQEVMDRRLLFDTVNDVVAKKLSPYVHHQPWVSPSPPLLIRKQPVGNRLVEEVWKEIQELPCPASEDVCDTLYSMLQRDLAHKEDNRWLDYSCETGEVGLELERMIFKELIEEVVTDFSNNGPSATISCIV